MSESANDVQRLPTNDVFSRIITDDERQTLLNGPTPLIIKALATAAQTLSPEDKRSLLENALQMSTRGKIAPEAVSDFVTVVNGGKLAALAPYTEAGDLAYLSIFCGVIRAAEESKNAADMVTKFTSSLNTAADKLLRGNPDKAKANTTLLALNQKLAQTANLPLPQRDSPVTGYRPIPH